MVEIANPIYDVVFKYLMNDEKVAKLLLSAIIGKEVVTLELRPTEHHFPVGELLAVLRMDFTARIQNADGHQELVILELQKAKMAGDILRFRRYLGEQYANKENVVREPRPEYPYRKALPILSIYFLGYALNHAKAPVIRVNRHYIDAATGEPIPEKEEFIESLTHDSIIIQIPFLKNKRRTELEQLLTIFDQSHIFRDPHFLSIDEEALPERYRPLLRRLQKAVADPMVRQTMDAEDDIIEEFKDYQRTITMHESQLRENELLIQQKEAAITEKEQVISEKEQVISDQKQQVEAALRSLNTDGVNLSKLALIFKMDESEVKRILGEK
ncbi:MAG: hypothetical protein SFV52_07895 [Saprospiraceae bacterium]|nr:hypothetical protein [Saprospiraceae bacterium]